MRLFGRRGNDRGGMVSIDHVVRNYNVVEASDGVLIVERPDDSKQLADSIPFGELGSTATQFGNLLREEYNPELRGALGLQKYDKMRRSDSGVRATLRAMKTPILGARWFIEPGELTEEGKKQADFIEWNLFRGMSISWPQVVWESLLMLDFGYYMFEKVYEFAMWRGEPVIMYKKLAPRHPLDVEKWHFDEAGGPRAVTMLGAGLSPSVTIPIDKLAVFTYDKEAGSIEGISLLRSAYKNWFYKENLYKIDAIQKERHGVGIPVIKLPPNWTQSDKALADQFGRNLRTNEKAHIVLPPFWEIMFAKLEGQHVDALASADHHNEKMYENILGSYIIKDLGSDTKGSRENLFIKSTRYVAEIIRDVFNKYCIPQLIDLNYGPQERYPELKVRRIGDTQDWRILSFALRNLIGAGAVQVDDPLEDWLRDEMDLPMLDPSSIREVASPQRPHVGPPRQSAAPQTNQGTRPPRSDFGIDKSGTSGVQ